MTINDRLIGNLVVRNGGDPTESRAKSGKRKA